jgi:hypothetical protein
MSIARHHAEWLSLLEISGPFLSLETLVAVFPQGIEHDNADVRRHLRQAYEEWLDNQGGLQADPALHAAWVRYVLTRVLELPEIVLRAGVDIPTAWQVRQEEHGETLTPDLAVVDPNDGRARLLVQIVPPSQKLESDLAGRIWKATPAARMQTLLYAADAPLGLVTNGEQWMLVYAPRNATAGYISWFASLWLEEPLTLRAWISLLNAYRFFGVPDSATLEAMLRRSADDQAEVTDQLGYQVRRAVEQLVHAIDVADRDAGSRLLAGVEEAQLYEAAITVMMRLVFLFCAEERDLFPLADELYAAHYAATPMRAQLRAAADEYGEEVIERRTDAWHRLLATTRAIYGGIQHEDLHLPAYGSDLFDPDRFPFLEGRRAGTRWIDTPAQPLPINNRTVLHLLEALQLLQVKAPGGERQTRRLSFRALDIEQIGHVYEGLLDHQAVRAAEPILGLVGTKDREPETPLQVLLEQAAGGASDAPTARLLDYLKEATGRSPAALRRGLTTMPDPAWQARLLAACSGDEALYQRILPFAGLIRTDDLERPVVILPGSVYVTAGVDRRSSGAHYTQRILTEPIVQHTLEPLVYIGPAEGLPKEQWQLRPAAELIRLKICDMAMGSGAFLVQVCRYLADRILEALEQEKRGVLGSWGSGAGSRPPQNPKTPKHQNPQDLNVFAPIHATSDEDERTILARRLVAERCLYGVDKNPLAVEMAKLSLWLITMDKGRAFSFLDHAFKCGDSLVGIHSLDQLRTWSLAGTGARQFGTLELDLIIERMIAARQQIEQMPVVDIEDQQVKGYLLADAEAITHDLKAAADMLIASYYNTLKPQAQATLREALLVAARDGADVEEKWRAHADLGGLQPFHWPLEFPEVFLGKGRTGFDGFVGNPPFVGGRRVREVLGDNYREYLNQAFDGSSGNADLSAFFFLRAYRNLQDTGTLGLIATNTIAQGDTRSTGLAKLESEGATIFRATNDLPWPGVAAVVVDIVHVSKARVTPPFILDGAIVQHITSQLDSTRTVGEPYTLAANRDKSFQGSVVVGMGFVLEPDEAEELMSRDPKNRDAIFPYLNGEDLNSHPEQKPSRWVINFFDWPRERTARGSWFNLDEKAQHKAAREGVVPPDYPGPVAADYPDCFKIVLERVYPVRKEVNREAHRKYWWHYGDKRPALYAAIAALHRVLVVAQTSKYHSFVLASPPCVFDQKLIVFPTDRKSHYTVLQSSVHQKWVLLRGSTLETRPVYTPTDCFETFPMPLIHEETLSLLGETYYEHRRQIMLARREGLTATYNRFHDPSESAADIARLRELHVEMDHAVAAAYNWGDLDLGHGFHETAQGLRYTISEPARRQVLGRLLALNHARYAAEVAAGLHEKKKGKQKQDDMVEGQMELL